MAGDEAGGEADDEPCKQGTIHAARDALGGWLCATLDTEGAEWLRRALLMAEEREAAQLAFGLAPRRLDKRALPLSADDGARAHALLPGWCPARWRLDEAARVLIVARFSDLYPDAIDRLARHADVSEQVALYRGLPLYGTHLDLHEVLGRGLRTHAVPVFEAIAHHNPWPAAHLDEHRWNHLVLKALFMEVPLEPLVGFEARLNPTLARMALDYAAERRAAGRRVPHDLWRCAPDADAGAGSAANQHEHGRAA